MNQQEYLDSFDTFVKDVYASNVPQSSEGQKGGLIAMKSYMASMSEHIKIINDKLTKEANRILKIKS